MHKTSEVVEELGDFGMDGWMDGMDGWMGLWTHETRSVGGKTLVAGGSGGEGRRGGGRHEGDVALDAELAIAEEVGHSDFGGGGG